MSNLTISRSYQTSSSWADVARRIANGADGYLNVKDSLMCSLKDGTDVQLDVLGVNVYNTNEVIFGFHDLHWNKRMNREHTNAGGWRDSQMRAELNDTVLGLLPDDLVEIITPRTIVQRKRGETFESSDKIWLPSYTEVFGEERNMPDVGDIQFEFFKDKRNRVKFRNGEPTYWWLRSPYVDSSTYFWNVSPSGYCGNNNAGNSGGVSPAFSICSK